MKTIREFTIELGNVKDREGFGQAFNDGFIRDFGGSWSGQSWDAFNDYLSWPEEKAYRLILKGWSTCTALVKADQDIFEEIIRDNLHVQVVRL